MIKIYLLSMVLLLVGCSTERTIKAIVVPPITKSKYIEIEDKELGNNYIINEENHFKSQNEIDTSLKYMEDSNMVLSSILNFNRLTHDDKFAILQPDKIFLNTIELKYLTLPTFNSNVKLQLIDLEGVDTNGELIKRSLYIKPSRGKLTLKFRKFFEDINDSKSIDYVQRKKETISKVYHDRAMGCIFVNNNDADFHGYANIQKTKNFKLSYLTYNANIGKNKEKAYTNRRDAYMETIFKVGESIDEGYSVISTSLGLFDNNDTRLKEFYFTMIDLKNNTSLIEKFYRKRDSITNENIKRFANKQEYKKQAMLDKRLQIRTDNAKKSIIKVNECIFNNDCKNNKFTWVLSLPNLEEENIDDDSEKNSNFGVLRHTMFVTAVSSNVSKSLSNKNQKGEIIFTKSGRVFSKKRNKNIPFFAINLPEKVLVAHGDKKLQFVGKSTSYATAIVSAVLYNLYSLNPNLTFHNAETILKKTAYNFQCEDNPTSWIDYKVLNSDYNYNYEINCSKHEPFKVGYIVNIREAYKEAIKYLVDTYHSNGKSKDFLSGSDFKVEFTKKSIICRYKTKLDKKDIEKELIIKYKRNGEPYIDKEKEITIKYEKKPLRLRVIGSNSK